jgi:L-alanine-DL-glutamate epimerase-like enolase superfamily enzyme
MKIQDVKVSRVSGKWSGSAFPPGSRQSRPLDIYAEFNDAEGGGGKRERISALYLEIVTDDSTSGLFGSIQETQAFVILKQLRNHLIGRDPLATELLLDQMIRLDRHGRTGQFMTGVSSVDCALWDLKGKVLGLPVYRLLGGPTRDAVPAYASMLGFSIEPDQAATIASEYQAKGFTAQKWFFRYGPTDGKAGMARNLAMAASVRDAVGDDYELMFDAFNGWTVSYAMEMVRALEPIVPTWMEEPIPPERISELRKIKGAARVPIATGEHVYTRWQVKELLVNEAVDVLQTDPDWTGGITELKKICALASAFEVPVVAHGHSLLPALHVAASESPATVPRVEFLIRGQETKQFFHDPIYFPENGNVRLPDTPGLGLALDESKIEKREEVLF